MLSNLESLFEMSDSIPTWLVSYNDRSYPAIDVLISLITPYRKVRVESKVYNKGRGVKAVWLGVTKCC